MKWRGHHVVAGWFGYDLVRKDKLVEVAAGPSEHLALFLERYRIDHVIDVGANVGQYAAALRTAGFRGRITSLEPVAACAETLRDLAARDPGWNVIRTALGRSEGEQELNVTAASAFSSFLEPNAYAKERYKRIAVDRRETVPVRRLDAIFEEIVGGGDRVFLKLDTQGYDLEAFAGATGIVHRLIGLESEMSAVPIYDSMPDFLESLRTFRSAGFEVTGLFPIAWDETTLRVIEFDCIMRNSRAEG